MLPSQLPLATPQEESPSAAAVSDIVASDPEGPTPDSASIRKPKQFSIIHLLLITTIIALSITVTMLYREVGPMRQELKRLRSEVGELHIEDPTKLHAVCVETDQNLDWKWRIWVPEGKRYRVYVRSQKIPKSGFPSDQMTAVLKEPGEQVIRYRFHRDAAYDRWRATFQLPSSVTQTDAPPWTGRKSQSVAIHGVPRETTSFEPTKTKVELIRYRVSETKGPDDIEDPSEGFMIWLELE